MSRLEAIRWILLLCYFHSWLVKELLKKSNNFRGRRSRRWWWCQGGIRFVSVRAGEPGIFYSCSFQRERRRQYDNARFSMIHCFVKNHECSASAWSSLSLLKQRSFTTGKNETIWKGETSRQRHYDDSITWHNTSYNDVAPINRQFEV